MDGWSSLAPWWLRAVGALIDGAVVAAITWGVRSMVGVADHKSLHELSNAYFPAIVTALAAASIYYPLIMRRTNGMSVGKGLMGIRVVRIAGGGMTVSLAVAREVLLQTGAVGSLALLPGYARFIGLAVIALDYLWPLWNRDNRALHDMMVGTKVVMAGES